jgi:hypothetical protein
MSSVETEPEEAPQAADADQPYEPWPGALSFEVDKKIGLVQFQSELSKAAGENCMATLVTEVPFSTDGTLWVMPNTLDKKVVQDTIDQHDFVEDYDTPQHLVGFKALMRKFNDDPTVELSDDDIQVAVKGILAQFPTING